MAPKGTAAVAAALLCSLPSWLPGAEAPPPTDPLREAEARGLRAVEPPSTAEAPKVVLDGGTVLTAAGARHAPGYVVMEGGRIAQVGSGKAPEVPGAKVLDVTGHTVTPGLIDTHSHIGVYPAPDARAHADGNEATAPTTPGVWAEHSFWPQDPQLPLALAGGITSLQVLPGSANLIGGRGVVLHNVPARGARAMRLPGAPETLKMACGENPKRVYGEKGGPSTRMGNLRGQREAFLAARRYLDAWDAWTRKKARFEAEQAEKAKKARGRRGAADLGPEPFPELPPERDLDLESLAGVLRGDVLAQVHCYRADDMLSFLQVADEFGFRVRSFHHALEAYKVRDVLAARGVAVSTWADWWGFKMEAWDGIPENLALVDEAGGRAVVHSDSAVGIQRLNQEAAKALRAGRRAGIAVTEEDALEWITVNPAWALGIDDQVGTLAPGKRADVVVWDGSPFSVYSRARWVFVDGVLRHDAARPRVGSDFAVGREVQP